MKWNWENLRKSVSLLTQKQTLELTNCNHYEIHARMFKICDYLASANVNRPSINLCNPYAFSCFVRNIQMKAHHIRAICSVMSILDLV